MDEEPRAVKCYACGNENVGKFFCNEECHERWASEHPRRGVTKKTIPEIMDAIKGWGSDPKRWKPVFSAKVEDMSTREVASLFS